MKLLPLYNSHFEGLYTDFKRAIKAQGYSPGREPLYPNFVREFLFFLENISLDDIGQVSSQHVVSYYEYLCQRPNQKRSGGLSSSSLRQQLYSLRLFFDHLLASGNILVTPLYLPKFILSKDPERNPISIEEVQLLYGACQTKKDRAFLSLAYGCGLRRSEIEQLNVGDIHFSSGTLTIRKGKFGKSRTVPMSNTVLKDLKEYVLEERNRFIFPGMHPTQHPLLLNNWGVRTSGQLLHIRFKELILRTNNAGLIQKNISLHHLRHSIATHLLDSGADIVFVQKFLGHVFLDTTHLYSKRRKQKQLLQQAFSLHINNNANPSPN